MSAWVAVTARLGDLGAVFFGLGATVELAEDDAQRKVYDFFGGNAPTLSDWHVLEALKLLISQSSSVTPLTNKLRYGRLALSRARAILLTGGNHDRYAYP